MFSKAIVRKPGKSMVNGITGSSLGIPDYKKALVQHGEYINALRECGLDVDLLEPEESFPDSVFVEDVALCTPGCAIITRPGAETRRGETATIKPAIENHYREVKEIEYPGTIDAGDIMMAGNHFYIGLSERTNLAGAEQMLSFLQEQGFTGSTVSLKEVLHLKTGVSYLENSNMLVCGEFTRENQFMRYKKIVVPEDEAYAANSLWINGTVLVPAGFPETEALIKSAGYRTITLDMSEFRKLDGGLSCLSLRF